MFSFDNVFLVMVANCLKMVTFKVSVIIVCNIE